MFLLKKIVSKFFLPVSVVIILLVVGTILLWFAPKNKQRIGRVLVTVGGVLLILFSSNFISNHMLKPFESRFDPLFFQMQNLDEPVAKYPIQYVVVLGGGHVPDTNLPVTSRLSGSSLVRLVEGIRLYRYFNSSKLVLSGGGLYEKTSEAETMAKVAMDLGVQQEDIIIEKKSRDTKDQAVILKDIVGRSLFVLVTSASHMPRSMAMFEKQGLTPFPAPTGHTVKKSRLGDPGIYFPSAGNLGKSENAFYEILGTLWAKIRGQTGDR